MRVARKPIHLSIFSQSGERKNSREKMVGPASSVSLSDKQLSPCHQFLIYYKGTEAQSVSTYSAWCINFNVEKSLQIHTKTKGKGLRKLNKTVTPLCSSLNRRAYQTPLIHGSQGGKEEAMWKMLNISHFEILGAKAIVQQVGICLVCG